MTRALLFSLALTAALAHSGAAEPSEKMSELLARGQEIEVVEVHPSIWLASGTSNAYLVKTGDGVVVVDTGLVSQADKTYEALAAIAGDAPLRALIFTHAHEDHVGGAQPWLEQRPDTLITHRLFPLRQHYYAMLPGFKERRASVLWGGVHGGGAVRPVVPTLNPDVLVDDLHVLEVGGVRFEVYATPGGEGPDAVSVWIPEWKVLFAGDALGPTQASFPNLFTLRGETLREALPLLASIERMRGLGPELMLPGHFDPLEGGEVIQSTLKRTGDAVRYVHEETVAGMNEGKDLWTLMREIELPPELEVSQQYGRVAWGVRAIYELYTGWFRYESTTELYDVQPRDVYPELVALAGGPDAVAARAAAKVEEGKPLEALHLAEVALSVDPEHLAALRAQLAGLEALAQQDGGKNFQVAGWLRHRVGEVKAKLQAAEKG
jgi:alkyl sulfatase BDS1-like metallo-beta-lactamase superfamily hydrolase